MSSATLCTSGCGNPCVDWHDWEKCEKCHAPFHYWQWLDFDSGSSKQRLGERVYICACLLWTALHDRRLGQRLLSQNPNWSAVCNYYSMVHSLRLFWFALYGGYPTGHAQLAQGLRGEFGAKANWTIEQLGEADKRISGPAFKTLLQYEFNAPGLSLQVPLTGHIFEEARKLRNDSNYESLILAHQYFHRGGNVNIPDEMGNTSKLMSDASRELLQYIALIISSVFRNDRPWIGRGSRYCGAALKTLLWQYVFDKIRGTDKNQQADSPALSDWFDGLPQMEKDMTNANSQGNNSADELISCIRYKVFGGKRSLMEDFQQKAKQLKKAVDSFATSSNPQSGMSN